MTLSSKAIATIHDRSDVIARTARRNPTDSLYWSRTDLMHDPTTGQWYTVGHGGHCTSTRDVGYLTRDEAIEWIAAEAIDPFTGYGYSREQAAAMVDGDDAGPGYRDR